MQSPRPPPFPLYILYQMKNTHMKLERRHRPMRLRDVSHLQVLVQALEAPGAGDGGAVGERQDPRGA